jgi:transposase InsO family protein
MKYEYMDEHREGFGLKSMCKVLRVSRSGYYAWKNRIPSERQKANGELLEHIREVHTRSRKLYGSPRITAELNDKGVKCGKNRVARMMRDHGIRGLQKRRRFRRTTDSRHDYALAANLLVERRQVELVWAADMTYVPTAEGWLYVSAVMNVKSRKIIGLSMGDRISQDLASAALKDAVQRQRPSEGLIHHSDRGRQYASHAYQALLKENGITASMSRSGNCYDNAYMESFFGTLKTELVHGLRYRQRKEARLSIFEYVMMFYNRRRRHSALGYKSPEQYEIQTNKLC